MNVKEKLADIRLHPERHRHQNMNDLHRCCTVGGSLHLNLVDAHAAASTRRNGGIACDVYDGPCACGAFH